MDTTTTQPKPATVAVGSDGSGSVWLEKDVQDYYSQLEMMAGRACVRLRAVRGDNLDRLSIRVAANIERAETNAQMALRCLGELEPTAMTRKRKTVPNFNEYAELDSQLSAARVALDNVLRALSSPNAASETRGPVAPTTESGTEPRCL